MKKFSHPIKSALLLLVIAFVLSACGNSPSTTTAAPLATNTSVPSATPQPPTATATYTATPIPTDTPEPTATPIPPTATQTDPDLLLKFDTGLASVTGLEFSNDGRYLAAFDKKNHQVKIWELATGESVANLPVSGALRVLFSPDGERLATMNAKVGQLWQIRDGDLLGEYPCADEFEMKIQFVPAGDLAILGILDEEQINLTYLPSGEQHQFVPQSENTQVKQGALSPAGDLLALGRSDGKIELYNVEQENPVRTIDAHIDWVMNLDFSPDGQFLASDSLAPDPYVKVWRVSNGALVSTPEDTKWDAGYLEFSPDGRLLVSYSPSYGVRTWLAADGSLFAESAYLPTFSPDGNYLGDWDESGLHIYQIPSGNLIQNFPAANLQAYGFPPTTGTPQIALALSDGTIEIRQISIPDEPLGNLNPPTPAPRDLYALLEATYGEVFNGEYVRWKDDKQVYLVDGFAAGDVDFTPIPIRTRSGAKIGTALATLRLLNLHDGNENALLVPLAIETPDGILFFPGLGDPIPEQEHQNFLNYLRDEELLGHAVTLVVAMDTEAAKEAIGMPEMPWQDDLLTAYQESWQPELEEMLNTGQSVSVDGQELLLIPLGIIFDSFDPLPLP